MRKILAAAALLPLVALGARALAADAPAAAPPPGAGLHPPRRGRGPARTAAQAGRPQGGRDRDRSACRPLRLHPHA